MQEPIDRGQADGRGLLLATLAVRRRASGFAYAAGAAALAALLIWQAADVKLGLTVTGGFAAALAVFFVAAWVVLRLLSRPGLTRRLKSRRVRFGLASAALAINTLITPIIVTGSNTSMPNNWFLMTRPSARPPRTPTEALYVPSLR